MFALNRLSGPAKGALAALALSIAGAGFAAHAGLTRNVAPLAPAPPQPTGYEAEDHFPGAALLQAVDDNAAPAPGTTGTADLPGLPLPAGADAFAADATVRPALPFVSRGTVLDQARALQCLTTAIYYEAASESDAGQAAVAQVILNRVRHPAFPATVCGVIYQGSERHTGCQFSYACDGAMARVPSRAGWERARRIAARALAGYVFAPVGLATHYHTYAVTPSWNRSLVMTDAVGAHFFHRWKGYWGTAGAFRQGYYGNEPVPGPHTPLAAASAALVLAPAPITTGAGQLAKAAVEASVAPTSPPDNPDIRPEHAESGRALAQYRDDSQILDRWKDSGKPLR